jgi:hypothetical protein
VVKVAHQNLLQDIKRQSTILHQSITRPTNIIILHLATTMNIIEFTIITADITTTG